MPNTYILIDIPSYDRAKPKSLFAQTSAKKFDGENVFGAKAAAASQPAPSEDSST